MDCKKLQALTFLATHAVRHLARRILRRKSPGLGEFLATYRPDGIFPIAPDIRRLMPDFSRCYACRLCDTACPEIVTGAAPSHVVTAFSRSLSDALANGSGLPACGSCRACEAICPRGVPVRAVMDFARNPECAQPS